MRRILVIISCMVMACTFAACHVPGKKQKVVMDEAFYNAAEMASAEICDCESPSMCMETIIERFTDYKDSKEFRDEVLRRVMECRKYKEHFAEAVDVVAKELCDEGNPTEKLDEITEELYPKYGYQDDPKFRQKAIDKAQECLNKKAPKPVKPVKPEPYDPKKDPNYKPPI